MAKITTAQSALLRRIVDADGVTNLRGAEIASGQGLVRRGLIAELDQYSWRVVPTSAGTELINQQKGKQTS